jgi:regulator of replication initiation timing
MKLLLSLALVLFLSAPVFAQEPKTTEVEQLRMQILNLQYALQAAKENAAEWIGEYGKCQLELHKNYSNLNNATMALQSEINKRNPDFDFDISTGKFTPKKKPEKK